MELQHNSHKTMIFTTSQSLKQFIKSEPIAAVDRSSDSAMDTEGKLNFFTFFSYLVLVFLLISFSTFNSFAQRKSDMGFFAGTSYYMGDLNPGNHFYSPSFAV